MKITEDKVMGCFFGLLFGMLGAYLLAVLFIGMWKELVRQWVAP